MTTLTSGKIRDLIQASNDAGVSAIFAIDHRDSMRIIIDPQQPGQIAAQQVTDTTAGIDRSEWEDACAEVDEASPVPWALLCGGDPIGSFVKQVLMACEAGASGFLVGRVLWADAMRARGAGRHCHRRGNGLGSKIRLVPCPVTFGLSMSIQGRWSQGRRTKAQSGLR